MGGMSSCLYPCGVSSAIHVLLAKSGVECPHCQALEAGNDSPCWKDIPGDHFEDYTLYGSSGEPPWKDEY